MHNTIFTGMLTSSVKSEHLSLIMQDSRHNLDANTMAAKSSRAKIELKWLSASFKKPVWEYLGTHFEKLVGTVV